MRTQVCLTVDVEFSIGGAFRAPWRYQPVGRPSVYCHVAGRSHGLGFLLESLARHNLSATFFVEALQTAYFGDAEMGRIVDEILAAGHEVQLHAHPCWLYFQSPSWRQQLSGEAPDDSCAGRSPAEIERVLEYGLETFTRWGVPRPAAFRAGNEQVDRSLYRALAGSGFSLASNSGAVDVPPLAVERGVITGPRWIEGILEVPPLTYTQFGRRPPWARRKFLTIQGCSWGEMRTLLWAARAAHVSPVVIGIHPFDFVRRLDPQYRRLAPNTLTLARFRQLGEFLETSAGDFETLTLTRGLEQWSNALPSGHSPLRTRGWRALHGLLENIRDTAAVFVLRGLRRFRERPAAGAPVT